VDCAETGDGSATACVIMCSPFVNNTIHRTLSFVKTDYEDRKLMPYRGILVYNIFLISISNSVSDIATNTSVLNIESSWYE